MCIMDQALYIKLSQNFATLKGRYHDPHFTDGELKAGRHLPKATYGVSGNRARR